jgi:hypothetical protein
MSTNCIENITDDSIKDELLEEMDFLLAVIGEYKIKMFKLEQKLNQEKCNNELLHNENENLKAVLGLRDRQLKNTQNGWTEEEFDAIAKGYADFGY